MTAAIAHYTLTELVHLITVCAMASMIQRFAAIAQLELESEVAAFLDEHRLPLETLEIKYPLAVAIEHLATSETA